MLTSVVSRTSFRRGSWLHQIYIRSTSLSVRAVFLRLLMPDSPCAAHLHSATLRQMIVHQYCFFLAISDTFLFYPSVCRIHHRHHYSFRSSLSVVCFTVVFRVGICYYYMLFMAAPWNRASHYIFALWLLSFLWPPYEIGGHYILPCGYYLSIYLSIFFLFLA